MNTNENRNTEAEAAKRQKKIFLTAAFLYAWALVDFVILRHTLLGTGFFIVATGWFALGIWEWRNEIKNRKTAASGKSGENPK